ncbi:Stilbene synthase [Rhynchospora pubera]|uniref:Stilbene synthase n=1 Tax=Rhynchospora pubera TaxID=906938 RepID=A0AAV8CMX0_9POAL|nr:Stilbene synthase [Rhynchospora pubera]KAJ4756972.1 Stilbene synthase [Rhynchospora pubera]KAJ4756974.1 Stilbene synthase [Rhynchospora pubera]
MFPTHKSNLLRKHKECSFHSTSCKGIEITKNMAIGSKATILAIGTALPPNIIYQSDYTDYYFNATNSEHLSELKQKLTRICVGSNIQKRHFYLTDEMLKDHPNLATHREPTLDSRNQLLAPGVLNLAKDAAEQALKEWSQPRSRITHLIFHTATGCVDMPGPDFELLNLLGLGSTVNRYMLFHNGCYAGGTVLRLAKDIAENNPDARILAVCSESTLSIFRGPSAANMDTLVGQALFGDGAGAIVIGCNPDLAVERPLYEIISASQSIIPGTSHAVGGRVEEAGFVLFLKPEVPTYITNNIRECLSRVFEPLGITDWNSLFWIVHPGGRKIIDGIENELNLDNERLLATRKVLEEYGNILSGGVIFVMDEMRKRSKKLGMTTTGEGAEFGVLLGFGPGVTIETSVIRSCKSL